MFSASVTSYNRSKGHSGTAAAAYRAGDRIEDQRTGTIHDYTKKTGIVSTLLIGWSGTRADLWNAVEKHAKRANSQIAREVRLALPHEVSDEARLSIATKFASWLRDQYRVAVDVAIHRPPRGGDERNDHAHLLLTPFTVQDDVLGEKIAILNDRATSQAEVEKIRAKAAELIQAVVENKDMWDHRSYAERGIDRLSTVHMGKAATHYERRTGIQTEIGAKNEVIKEINALKVQQRRANRYMNLIQLFRQEYTAYKEKQDAGHFPATKTFNDWLDLFHQGSKTVEAMRKIYRESAEAEEDTMRKLRKAAEEKAAADMRLGALEAAARRKAMLAQAIDYINILGPDRREREPQLKEILRQHEAAKRMGDWDSAATILIEFWRGKLDQYGHDRTAPEIARADIAKADAASQPPRTSYAEDAIRSIQDPQPYPERYKTAQQLAEERKHKKGKGRGDDDATAHYWGR